jgi:hypothetical protein
MEARRKLFSYIGLFGMPSIFLTVNPDDLTNYRIVVYSMISPNGVSAAMENVNDLSDAQVLADFKMRSEARVKFPGLCAEEYEHIVILVIKHLFNWDMEKQQSNGIGIFAEISAFVLATEEQGRKTLHGHFLVFVKSWNQIMDQGCRSVHFFLGGAKCICEYANMRICIQINAYCTLQSFSTKQEIYRNYCPTLYSAIRYPCCRACWPSVLRKAATRRDDEAAPGGARPAACKVLFKAEDRAFATGGAVVLLYRLKASHFFKMVAAVSSIARHFLWCLVGLERLGSNLFLKFPVTVNAYTCPKIGLISSRCMILLVQFVEMIEARNAVPSTV